MSKKKKNTNVNEVNEEKIENQVDPAEEQNAEAPAEDEEKTPEKKKLGKLAKAGIVAAIVAIPVIVAKVVRAVQGGDEEQDSSVEDLTDSSCGDSEESETDDEVI